MNGQEIFIQNTEQKEKINFWNLVKGVVGEEGNAIFFMTA